MNYHIGVKTNSLGFRNSENLLSNPFLIAFGDSFTFSPYVPNHDAYPIILQKKLRSSDFKELEKVNVLNAGVSGTTIFHQYELLKANKLLNPYMIILQVLDNDIYNASAPYLRFSNINLENKTYFNESIEEKNAYKKCKL